VARLAGEWGYDGLEIASSGDRLDVARHDDAAYVAGRKEILERNGLQVWTISNHLAWQAVCDDPIDERHRGILSDRVWGNGDPEGVRQRAADELKDTARMGAALGVSTVTGFIGSSIWKYVAMCPPATEAMVDAGYAEFAERFSPILDVFEAVGVRFAHEVHPSEIAYGYWTTVKTLEAIGDRPSFGLNWDPSHMVWQDLDPVGFIWDFKDRIYHVHCKDTEKRLGNGRQSSHLPWADPRRDWDFIATGHGDVPWEDAFRMLNAIEYQGPLSVEWEDAGMDRLICAPEASASCACPHTNLRRPASTQPSPPRAETSEGQAGMAALVLSGRPSANQRGKVSRRAAREPSPLPQAGGRASHPPTRRLSGLGWPAAGRAHKHGAAPRRGTAPL